MAYPGLVGSRWRRAAHPCPSPFPRWSRKGLPGACGSRPASSILLGMRSAGALSPRLDPGDERLRADPYPLYAEVREQGGLCRIGPGTWGVTRHADVSALLRDPRLSSEFPAEYHRMSSGDGPASSFF